MPKKTKSIPVNPMADEFDAGIGIGRMSVKDLKDLSGVAQAHRDDYHLFFLTEKGTVILEIDFQKYTITPSSVVYIHPNQVHRVIAVENIVCSGWSISNENLNAEYLNVLNNIAPVKPLSLTNDTFSILSDAVSLTLKLSEQKHEKLYNALLKNSCNTLVALVASQYVGQSESIDKQPRFETIAKAFRTTVEHNFITDKRPADYAQKLNISTSYLNECVKNATGYSVSHHIQQRVILEAKRLLYHSDKSVKEIASELGYTDYPYFSRLFTKATGMTALTFRNKNRN